MRDCGSGAAVAGGAASAPARPLRDTPAPRHRCFFSVSSTLGIPLAQLGGSRCVSPLELTRYPRSSIDYDVLLDDAARLWGNP